jgi:hypothetical protein
MKKGLDDMVQETQMVSQRSNGRRVGLYKTAILLSQITVFYNLLEGLVSVFLGLEDETLSLLGFGIDSFVEVISGIGGLDSLGAVAISVFAFREGREAFEKARSKNRSCHE